MNLAHADKFVADNVGDIVDALASVCSTLPPIMLVGATCRDALHIGQGHAFQLRGTDDLDLALAVAGLDQFEQLRSNFPRLRSGAGQVRHQIAGAAVDLVPFGPGVEEPDGLVTAQETMSVFGFQDALASSRPVVLKSGTVVHLPSVAGYTLLKLKAWADRSAFHQYKDGGDLACAMFWYQNDPNVTERLYVEPHAIGHLVAADTDPNVAAVRLLVDDALRLLPADRRTELRSTWDRLPGGDASLARHLSNNLLNPWPKGTDAPTRLAAYSSAVRNVIAAA
ncbi:hypothetical protein SANBI_000262 [Sanguibacter sp. 4.1]|uniref:Nucleotidyltransferase n=1 Tax=Sanguibacter biliveldensis TaxID=3030830 RepID=A0AAF1BYB1_9MICO|nr:hypothetical protein [Sanguibacter sp. 4.1]WPF82651.1 hypothetical protein SANBI_000262 [Sanguibacter sp. 4.1]